MSHCIYKDGNHITEKNVFHTKSLKCTQETVFKNYRAEH